MATRKKAVPTPLDQFEQTVRMDERLHGLAASFTAHEQHDEGRFAKITETQVSLQQQVTVVDKKLSNLAAQLWIVGTMIIVLMPIITLIINRLIGT